MYHPTCKGTHQTAEEARRCQGIGYGGEPLAPAPRRAPSARTAQPATEKQANFIRNLVGARLSQDGELAGDLLRRLDEEQISKADASAIISELLKLPSPKIERAPEGNQAEVPGGRYGIVGADSQVRFYQVDKPKEGKWAGYTFVKLLVGAPGGWNKMPINRSQTPQILSVIAADVAGAARIFGDKYSQCGFCSSPLSDPRSRAAGYGEICAGNHALPYPSKDAALEMLGEVAG
jgi:Family of unknown function (DUF6011)